VVQLLVPPVEYVPAEQLVHEVAPFPEYFPDPQLVHDEDPAVLYVPAEHSWQVDAALLE
jgi:hypothetical protein